MNRDEYVKRLETFHSECMEIVKAKSADYATGDDPFRNFKSAPMLGVSVAKGILVRMGDKMIRAANLLDQSAAVKGEGIADTLNDLANYALILRLWLEEQD